MNEEPRVILADGYDVTVHESAKAAASELCWADDAGDAWTEDGHVVHFAGRTPEPVIATVTRTTDVEGLRAALTGFLDYVCEEYGDERPGALATAPLAELVDRVAVWESPAYRNKRESLWNRISWYLLIRRR